MEYRLTGAQDPANRIDRVVVGEPSDDYPDGRTLELNGAPVELNDEEYARLSSYLRLDPVEEGSSEAAVFTAEAYPDDQPAEEQQVTAEAPPAPEAAQPEAQQVARPRARKVEEA